MSASHFVVETKDDDLTEEANHTEKEAISFSLLDDYRWARQASWHFALLQRST